jgi:hypothetical protein
MPAVIIVYTILGHPLSAGAVELGDVLAARPCIKDRVTKCKVSAG